MSWSNITDQAALPNLGQSRQQREQRRRHVSVGDWFGGLSRRFSQKLGRQLSQQEVIADATTFATEFVAAVERNPGPPAIVVFSPCDDETDWGRPRKKKRAPTAAVSAVPTTAATSSGCGGGHRGQWLSHRERHEINLMYHILRDHRDAIQLQVAAACCGAEEEGEEETACGSNSNCSSLLWWWRFDEEADEETAAAAAAAAGGDDSGSDCCGGDAFGFWPLKSCDSDSCLSTCSNSSKRFKHKRRTDRWNQEYDFEFKVQHGFVDPGYFGVCQIK